MTLHKIIFDSFDDTWIDAGPWLGETGFTGYIGPTGIGPGPTGPSSNNFTGPTGPIGQTGATGATGSVAYVQTGFLYGSGFDSDIVVNSITTLTRDLFARDITVLPLCELRSNGYRIFASRELRNSGTVSANGINGTDAFTVFFPGQTNSGSVNNNTGFCYGGSKGGDGHVGSLQPGVGDPSLYAMYTNSPNINFYYPPPTGLGQGQLYYSGNGNSSVPQGSATGAGYYSVATGFKQTLSQAVINAAFSPIIYDKSVFGLIPLSGGAGGAAGFSTNSNIAASAGPSGGGVLIISAATINSPNGLGRLTANGGSAGKNLSVADSSGSGAGGGLILVKSATPASQWNMKIEASGGAPQNQPFLGGPVNLPDQFGQPGQIIIFDND